MEAEADSLIRIGLSELSWKEFFQVIKYVAKMTLQLTASETIKPKYRKMKWNPYLIQLE